MLINGYIFTFFKIRYVACDLPKFKILCVWACSLPPAKICPHMYILSWWFEAA